MFLSIGEIVKAQGIKGEVKIKPYSTDCSHFTNLKLAHLDAFPHKLRSTSLRGGFAYVLFEGINDRNAAEKLVGKIVKIDRRDAAQLSENEYYVCDVLGSKVVFDDGDVLGNVIDVQNFGSADVYTVRGVRTVRFPFLKRIIIGVDIENKVITLIKKEFEGVCVYED